MGTTSGGDTSAEFGRLLEQMGWSDRRCADALEAKIDDVHAWRKGRPVPQRIMRMMRALYAVHDPSAREDAAPETSRRYAHNVDNPHDNWHGFDADAFARKAKQQRARATSAPGDDAPAAPDASPVEDASEKVEALERRVHELSNELFQVRKSYRRLSEENARLRDQLRQSGSEVSDFGPYAVLGISPQSDWAEIKAAYLRLSQKHHPDRGGDAEKMKEVTEAYAELRLVHIGS